MAGVCLSDVNKLIAPARSLEPACLWPVNPGAWSLDMRGRTTAGAFMYLRPVDAPATRQLISSSLRRPLASGRAGPTI